MSARKAAGIVWLAVLALIPACSSVPAPGDPELRPADAGAYVVWHGTVTAIDVIPVAARSRGAGALLGAVVGSPAPYQAGNGIGRAAATGLGAADGAAIGKPVEPRSKGDGEIYRVSVRLDDGRIGQFDYQRIDDLRIGHRVRVEGGRLHRV